MARYNSANVKSCNPQLNKVKSEINNGTEVTLNLLPKVIGWSKDEANLWTQIVIFSKQLKKMIK